MSQNTFKAPGNIELTLSRKTSHRVSSVWGAKRDQLVAAVHATADAVRT